MTYQEQLEQRNEDLMRRLAKLEAENDLLNKISYECLKKSDSCSIEKIHSSNTKILLVKNDSTSFSIELNNVDVKLVQEMLGKVIEDKMEYQKSIFEKVNAIDKIKKDKCVF